MRTGSQDRIFEASYQRFVRKQAPITLRLEFRRAQRISVWISSAYLERFTVNAIIPEPDLAIVDAEGTEYRFATAGGLDTAVVRFSLEAERAGGVLGSVGVSRETAVPIRQFVYP